MVATAAIFPVTGEMRAVFHVTGGMQTALVFPAIGGDNCGLPCDWRYMDGLPCDWRYVDGLPCDWRYADGLAVNEFPCM